MKYTRFELRTVQLYITSHIVSQLFFVKWRQCCWYKEDNLRWSEIDKQDHQRWGYSTVERFAKKLNKDKRKGQRKNYILIWGGSSSVSIFFTSAFAPSALRPCVCRICRWYEGSWHSLDFYWLSSNFYWLSTDFYWFSTDFYWLYWRLLNLYWLFTDVY